MSSRAEARLERARGWLCARPASEPVWVVGPTLTAAGELLRAAALERGAAFGWQRATLEQLAAELAQPELIESGRVPISALAREALVARVLQEMRQSGDLSRLERVATGPGLARALARTLGELREARVAPESLRGLDPALAELSGRYAQALADQGLADRADVLRCAERAATPGTVLPHPILGAPLLLLDLPVRSAAESALLRALGARAPALLATLPAGDARARRHLEQSLALPAQPAAAPSAEPSPLESLQTHLFADTAPRPPRPSAPDPSVLLFSAPGESRECVEIARRALKLAGEGVRFDQMAVLLRSANEYRPHLEESLSRAGIPVHFARGTVRPDPAGRALLALLRCARTGLSANAFAEYLSLGQVPAADAQGAPPPAAAPGDRYVTPETELLPARASLALSALGRTAPEPDPATAQRPEDEAVVDGVLRAPRRWERLLVNAAVIGGADRWRRRLDGLEQQLRLDLAALEDPDDPRSAPLERELADLGHLRRYALPLIEALAALPERASWNGWLDALSALASRALRNPERVHAVLGELAPMGPVGPAEIGEVLRVLEPRLQEIAEPPASDRHGRLYVAPALACRGLSFRVVFVPGLAERIFPRKLSEDPTLRDATRLALDADLERQEERLAEERLALHLAVGAAAERVLLSYPRLDLDQARPRVPSFYALEALRASEGRLPGFDELAARAETVSEARVGWPAPRRPADAIDAAEHDLALLEDLLEREPDQAVGTARYLLGANPHLGRALRFRARRWLSRWTPADGLVDPVPAAARALSEHRLAARSFSPTALQKYARCPYQFFLYAVHRLAPREVPERIEELGPLERGSLVHEVQFELLQALRTESALPVTPQGLGAARARLDGVLDAVAGRYRDDLAPAIERIWRDGIESIRADLREWLRRASEDDSGFVPHQFELSFGLRGRRDADPDSVLDPVPLACGLQLRGSIDLVERRADGALRATDHKTGRERFGKGSVVGGGASLQPALYALALEALYPDATVEGGRLYYCTAAGGFAEHTVPLDKRARESAQRVAHVVGEAIEQGFLPAAPEARACQWCDYQVVCGPYEELRTARKPPARLAPLRELRELP